MRTALFHFGIAIDFLLPDSEASPLDYHTLPIAATPKWHYWRYCVDSAASGGDLNLLMTELWMHA
jgi:hypothetical protein